MSFGEYTYRRTKKTLKYEIQLVPPTMCPYFEGLWEPSALNDIGFHANN
jgi:hypothetical protein